MKTKKKKIWTYSVSCSYDITLKDGTVVHVTMQSQLYQTGIYVILNNDPALQFGTTPEEMVRSEKKIRKDPKIKNLKFGTQLRVTTDNDDFYINAPDDDTTT